MEKWLFFLNSKCGPKGPRFFVFVFVFSHLLTQLLPPPEGVVTTVDVKIPEHVLVEVVVTKLLVELLGMLWTPICRQHEVVSDALHLPQQGASIAAVVRATIVALNLLFAVDRILIEGNSVLHTTKFSIEFL